MGKTAIPKIMCDASDYDVGDVLGQRVDKILNVLQHASKTLDSCDALDSIVH